MAAAFAGDARREFEAEFPVFPVFFPGNFEVWRRVRIRLLHQPRSRVSVNPGRFRLPFTRAKKARFIFPPPHACAAKLDAE
jgi:hypothetical protein